ncbi:MAG: DUF885 family protein, partial [Flavobacterium sp.]
MKAFMLTVAAAFAVSCSSPEKKTEREASALQMDTLFERYYAERMKLFPLEATLNGDNEYNDQLPCEICDSYRSQLKTFYEKYLKALANYDRTQLTASEQISYDVLKREMEIGNEGLRFHDNYQPIQQFWSTPITMGQLGSGSGNQPFKTVKDYDNFLSRISAFYSWCDSAIVYMRKGISSGEVPPKILMERTLPQMKNMVVTDPKQSVFYGSIKD